MIHSIQSALQGMNRSQQAMSRHAHNISQYGDPQATGEAGNISLPEEMVGMMVSQRSFEANIPVMRAADEMLGHLIDILA